MICQISMQCDDLATVGNSATSEINHRRMLENYINNEDIVHCYTSFGRVDACHVWQIRCDEQMLSFLILKLNANFVREIYEQY